MKDIQYITWHVREPSFRFTIDLVEIIRNPYNPSQRLGKDFRIGFLSREYELKSPVAIEDYPLKVEKSDLIPTLSEACRRIMKTIWQ
jgi:hypothetical protein